MVDSVKSAWGDTPETMRAIVKAGAFMGSLLVAVLSGGALTDLTSDATGLDTPHLDQLARNTAAIDTVLVEQRAARQRDAEQTRALRYLTCAMRVSRGNSTLDCEALFIDGQLEAAP